MTKPRYARILWLLTSFGYEYVLANHDPLIDTYFLDEIPITLKSSRLTQHQTEAPVAVTVIDKTMIKASGAKEITELFRLVPGMQVGLVDGSTPTVTYHGMADYSTQRLQILVDGTSIFNPLTGGAPWENLPFLIEDIERIEVTRGPNTTSYGPNSFLGVINITTSHAAQTQGLTTGISAGNNNYKRGILRYGGTLDNLDYRISLAHNESSGLNNAHDDFRTEKLSGRVDYQIGARDVLQYNFGYSQGPREIAYNPTLPGFFPRTRDDRLIYQHLRWDHQIETDESLALQFTFNHNRSKDKHVADLGGVLFPINRHQRYDSFDVEMQHNFNPFRNTRLGWGTGIEYNLVKAPFEFNSDDEFSEIRPRLFGSLEWRVLDQFIVNIGALYEFNDEIHDQHNINGRIGLNYLINEDQSLRFLASKDSHAPALAASNLNTILRNDQIVIPIIKSDSDFGLEHSYSFELGYHGQFFNRILVTDFKIYRQHFNSLAGVDLDSSNDRVLANTENAITQGYEMQVDFRPAPNTLVHLGYAHIHISTDNPENGLQVSAPDDSFNILVSHLLANQWRLGSAFYYRSGMEFQGFTDPLGPYKRWDIMTEKTFKLSNQETLTFSATHQFSLDDNKVFDDNHSFDSRTFFGIEYSYQ